MLTSIFKKIFAKKMIPIIERQQTYRPAIFTDHHRLEKIKKILPLIDQMYEEHAEKHHIPGYAFGIMVEGALIYANSGGYANIHEEIPATPQSMFRVASMTKSLTAMAILKLRDEAKLRLDDLVYDYIPEMKNQKLTEDASESTIRDLLTHAAGFSQDDPWADRNLHITNNALINLLKNGLYFSHATAVTYEYSNLAYGILGCIIQKISGVSYQEYIKNNIWHPLGMQSVAWEFSTIAPTLLVHGYHRTKAYCEEEPLLHDGSFASMGGMISSIESFSRYVGLHQAAWPPRNTVENGPVKRSSIREMHQPHRFDALTLDHQFLAGAAATAVSAYGYGLRWIKDAESKVYVGHSGGLPGFGSNWLMMPEYGLAVMFFANNRYAPSEGINLKVLNKLVKEAALQPYELPSSQILHTRKNQLLQLLPNWDDAATSGIFADNFFLDASLESLQNETSALFAKAGQINRISDLIPENQLRGYFMVAGAQGTLKISFTLTPQNPPLIQKYQIEEMTSGNPSA